MTEPTAPRAAWWRGVRLRITVIAMVVTAAVLLSVGALIFSIERDLLLDDLATADPGVRREVTDAANELAWRFLDALPLAVGCVGLLVWWLVGRTLHPVEAIRTEVAELSAADLHRRVPVPGTGDEIDRLAVTMNGMLGRLEAAKQRQDRFVADASHELRTPLARMITELEVDEAHPGSTDPATARAAQLDHARSLASLVDALLVLAREDEGVAAPDPVDLDDIVLAEVERSPGRPGVTIDASAVSAAQVRVHARLLTAVVRNLLDNALRHAASHVRLRVEDVTGPAGDGSAAVLSVENDGPGIPPEARTHVFERFARLDEARSRPAGGAGLGLAIVRDIVERAGGTVGVEDSGEAGQGTRFVVRLPAA